MEDFMESGEYEPLRIVCPRCGSENVVIATDEYGYYMVVECWKCNYKHKNNLEGDWLDWL